MNLPRVDVIINYRDSIQFLDQALESLAHQSFTNWRLVFVDNASVCDPSELILKYVRDFNYIRLSSPVKLGKARNVALENCFLDLIAFLDCDDVWHKDKLQYQVDEFLLKKNLGICTTDCISLMQESGKESLINCDPKTPNPRLEIVQKNFIVMSSAVVSNTILKDYHIMFNEKYEILEDVAFYYDILSHSLISNVPQPLTTWRSHPDNTTYKNLNLLAIEKEQFLNFVMKSSFHNQRALQACLVASKRTIKNIKVIDLLIKNKRLQAAILGIRFFSFDKKSIFILVITLFLGKFGLKCYEHIRGLRLL